jgi:hypothetical protein
VTYSLTPRALDIPTPYLFRRGVTQTISAPVRYGSGAPLVSPVEAESSITITKPDGTSFTSGAAVTVASSTATYEFTSTASEVLDEGWVVEWSLVFSSGDDAEVYRHTGILVEYSLFPVISARDVFIEEPELEFKVPQQQGEQGTDEGWQPQIDAAWHSVVRRLIERGEQLWKLREATGLHDAVLYEALKRCTRAVKQDPDGMWREKYRGYVFDARDAWAQMKLQYDTEDFTSRKGHGTTNLCAVGRPIW